MAVAIDGANKYRQVVGQLLAAHKELMSIDKEYIAADIAAGITDDGDVLEASDFPDIVKTEFTDGVAAAQAIMVAIEANKTPLYIVSDGGQR
jgi:hypothetical protein